jgi:hypothetical protein
MSTAPTVPPPKGVVFISKQFGIREFYSATDLGAKTFEDIADELYKRLLTSKNQPIRRLMRERTNELPEEHRVGLIKFFYIKDNTETPISQAEQVIRFYLRTGANEVLFFVDVIGGTPKGAAPFPEAEDYSHYQFLNHATPLLRNAELYGEWQLREYAPNRYRLVKTVFDKDRRLITVMLKANIGYPRYPPEVVTMPRAHDPCFGKDGKLNWTMVAGQNRFTWELYVDHENPLVYLLEELKRKYGLIF